MTFRSRTSLAVTLLAAALVLGCGKKKEDGGGKSAPPPSTATPPAAGPGSAAPAAPVAPATGSGSAAVAAAQPPAAPAAPTGWCGATPCPCEPGTENKHYNTELLQSCKLTQATDIQGYPVKPGSEGGDVAFGQDGKLRRFYLDKEHEVQGFVGQAKTGVELFADGSVQSINLTAPREIGGFPCRSSVTFFEGGKLRRCDVDKETELSGHKVQPGDIVTLDQDGKLHRWEVGDRVQKIGPHQCSGYLNYVHPDGALLRCGFAKPTKVAGKTYKAGDLVCFDPAGKVADCVTFTFDVGAG